MIWVLLHVGVKNGQECTKLDWIGWYFQNNKTNQGVRNVWTSYWLTTIT